MSLTTANVLVGHGTLNIAGVDVGATVGGFFVRDEPEYYDAFVDQSVGVQKKKLVRRRMFARADVGEGSLANLRMAHGLPSSALVGVTLTFNSTELGVITGSFVGTNPAGFNRTYTFARLVQLEQTEVNYQRDGQTIIPMEFEILPSVDGADEFYTIVDAAS